MRRAEKRPRVLIIVENETVPADRRVWDECRALVAAGYGVSVICPRAPGEPAYQELEGVLLHRYAPPRESPTKLGFVYEYAYSWVHTAALTAKVLVRDGFDAIQACNPPDIYFALAAPLKLVGKRFVFDQHDLSPELYVSRFGRSEGLLLAGLRAMERATYQVADHVIATNQWYREIALARGGCRAESVTVVRNGPDLQRMRRRPPLTELKNGKRFLCCFLGVMEPHDGVDVALRAAHELVHEHGRRDCHFAFLGDGESLPGLRRLAHDLDLKDWVTFTGWAQDEMICDYLSTADIGLQPDPKDPRTNISTVTKTMEYMAFALPVVAFDLEETRATAADAAVYAQPNDVVSYTEMIDTLLDDPPLRAEMGRVGRRRVEEQLAWDHQKIAYVQVYDRLLRRCAGPSLGSPRMAGKR
ncbi:MAG: glycosyltransferase family 4 protein [Egibacteraceae bacterium]